MKILEAASLSHGIAVAPLFVLTRTRHKPEAWPIEEADIPREMARFMTAVIETKAELSVLKEKTAEEIGADEAAIFGAHLLVLEDPLLHLEVSKKLKEEKLNVETVLTHVVDELSGTFAALGDPVMRERSADIADVGERLINKLLGRMVEEVQVTEPSILVAHDISPSTAATLDTDMILGLVVEIGSPTSHTAILARALGIPAVVVKPGEIAGWQPGTRLIVDGVKGAVIFDPDEATVREYEQRSAELMRIELALRRRTELDAVTTDGVFVNVAANLEIPSEIAVARENGAGGVGLYRTEYLFMNRKSLPSEEEQYQHYRVAAEAFPGQSVLVRTIDIGGDKFLSDTDVPRDINPFLGLRAIRFSLQHPDHFKVQLKAILRATRHGNVKVMFPMIACIEEVSAAIEFLTECAQEVDIDPDDVDVGIMIETPSAALEARTFATYLDFFSIGTNDLVQYTMAAERGNEQLAYLHQPTHPAILKLIGGVVATAHEARIDISVCGEMASDLRMIPLLLGAGVTSLSMNPRAIPAVKEFIRNLSAGECRQLFADAANMIYAAEIGEMVEERFADRLREFGRGGGVAGKAE